MTEFKGFPSRMQFTPVPNIVFSSLLPQMTDIAELKILLYLFHLIYGKKGNLRYVTFNELSSQAGLLNGLTGQLPASLKKPLETLVQKGILVNLQLDKAGAQQDLYFLNNESNKATIARIRSGEIEISGFQPVLPVNTAAENPPDIFTLYEQNIGLLTPLIADELREASKQYPESWIKEAIGEASALNKRNWRYIARILEHWLTEGKDDGTHRRNITQNADPDKYIRGKYGHMVQR